MKLPIELVGYTMILYGIWNAINDPLFGYLSDRTRTKMGTADSVHSRRTHPTGPCLYFLMDSAVWNNGRQLYPAVHVFYDNDVSI